MDQGCEIRSCKKRIDWGSSSLCDFKNSESSNSRRARKLAGQINIDRRLRLIHFATRERLNYLIGQQHAQSMPQSVAKSSGNSSTREDCLLPSSHGPQARPAPRDCFLMPDAVVLPLTAVPLAGALPPLTLADLGATETTRLAASSRCSHQTMIGPATAMVS